MFTGIVTDIGSLERVETREEGRLLRIGTRYDVAGLEIGASVAHDGICLTVTEKGEGEDGLNWFEVFAARETLAVTRLGTWQEGRRINLERALKIGDELGGHIVAGHVDGMGEIVGREETAGQITFTFEVAPELARFIAPKGSVALNGVSLTVNAVEGTRFSVHLIPHTVAVTSWGDYGLGDFINVEVDLMARYAARLMEPLGPVQKKEH